MIEILLYFFGLLFALEFGILLYGLIKSKNISKNIDFEPTVSIIVAARNEENNILACLESLSNLEYPLEKMEIIVVNDQSVDGTEEIISGFIKNKKQFKLFNASEGKGKLVGKTNAITQGIENSTGEIIMFTDADCIVPKSWVKETVPYFTKEVGIVAGFTILKAKNAFEGLQSLEWAFLYSVGAGAAYHGFPLTAVGNNLALRRKAYDEVGGYRNIPFSVTEDYILTRSIVDKTNYKLRFPLNVNTLIWSLPCANWKQFFHQKQRWSVGGLDMVAIGFIIFGIPFSLTLLLLISFFFVNKITWLIILLLKIVIELVFVFYPLKKFRTAKYLKYFLQFEIFYIIYVLSISFVALFTKKVVWKERVY